MPAEVLIAHSLNEIVAHNVRALIRRFHLSRDCIIGLIGDRGSGKSIGGANITIRDNMMSGDPCWSNMQMKLNVKVGDEAAQAHGLKEGGIVTYEAQHLEKQEFLKLDGRYEGGIIYLDEPNIEYGEARRSNTNTNLATADVAQELRKFGCGLNYSVISEMFIDVRIREATDIFIKCKDIALNFENLRSKMEQGHVFEWEVLAMTPRVAGNGNTYRETHKPIATFKITMHDMWGIIDTYERQVNEGKYSGAKQLTPVQIVENPEAVKEKNKWTWLYRKIDDFYKKHANDGDYIEVTSNEFCQDIGEIFDRWGYVVRKIKELIPGIEVKGRGSSVSPTIYTVPNRILV